MKCQGGIGRIARGLGRSENMCSTEVSLEYKMADPTLSEEAKERLFQDEPSSLNGHRRFCTRIHGMHCSLCTGTIQDALGSRIRETT